MTINAPKNPHGILMKGCDVPIGAIFNIMHENKRFYYLKIAEKKIICLLKFTVHSVADYTCFNEVNVNESELVIK